MIELEHSPLGGSGAERWLNCAGSFLLHRELLESGEFEATTSEFAELGTAAHELCAKCLTDERDPFEYASLTFNGFIAGEQINLDAVAAYVDICERIWPRDGKGDTLVERTLHHIEAHPLLKGTVDFGYWSASRGMWLRDYKNGAGIGVYARDNAQLLYYAFVMTLAFDWLRDSAPDDFKVNLGIVQPNYRSIFDPEDVWETTMGYVRQWGNDVLLPRMHNLIATRDVSDSDFVPGSHCQFCPVILECPKAQAAYQKFAEGTEFPSMLTNPEIDEFMRDKDLARKFMTELEKVAYARALAGADFQNAKLVEKKTNRTWREGAAKALVEALGDAAYKAAELKSPAEIEKLSTRGKNMAQEWGFMPKAEGLSLASMSDRRPAAKPPANATVFAAFETSPEEAGF